MQRKSTPRGQMSSSGMGPAIAHLPFHLKVLFEPREPLEYKPPLVKRRMPPYSGVASFLSSFETTAPPTRKLMETPKERKERLRKEKQEKTKVLIDDSLSKWDPKNNPNATQDGYCTLFVGRLSYDATEKQLQREFGQYGTIKLIRIVTDNEEKSKGYAFIEFGNEDDLKAAYKHADGKKIDGRRVVVDVERGRTVKDWRPRKFGGGIGETRKGGEDVNKKYSGREEISNLRGRNDSHSDRGGGGDRYGPPSSSRSSRDDYRSDRSRGERSRREDSGKDRRKDDRVRDRSRSRDRDRRSDRDSYRSRRDRD